MIGRLHVLTAGPDHAAVAAAAVSGGADVIQLREKGPPVPEVARAVADLCRGRVQLIVNDRVDEAERLAADGVHLGRDDAAPSAARRRLGSAALIGRTANSLDEARSLVGEPIDYLGVGPIFGTRSKADPAPELGLDGLAAIVDAVQLPVIAIGNIYAERVAEILATGAHGVAVLSAVCAAADPVAATRQLRDAVDDALRAAR